MAPELGTMSEGDTGLSGCAMAAMAGRAADGRTARLHGDLHMFVMTVRSQEVPPLRVTARQNIHELAGLSSDGCAGPPWTGRHGKLQRPKQPQAEAQSGLSAHCT